MDSIARLEIFRELLEDTCKPAEEEISHDEAFERFIDKNRESLGGEASLNASRSFLWDLDEHTYNRSFEQTTY